jgi:hypothetical protein
LAEVFEVDAEDAWAHPVFDVHEIVGLQWRDFDFEKWTLLVQRGVVHCRVDDVKTEYSRDVVPIAPELAKDLLAYRDGCYPTEEGWLFANPATDRPYHQEEIQKKHIRVAAKSSRHHVPSRLEDVQAQLSLMARPDGRADRRPARADAPREYSDNDERLWQGDDGQQAAGAQYRRSNGPAGIGERRA